MFCMFFSSTKDTLSHYRTFFNKSQGTVFSVITRNIVGGFLASMNTLFISNYVVNFPYLIIMYSGHLSSEVNNILLLKTAMYVIKFPKFL